MSQNREGKETATFFRTKASWVLDNEEKVDLVQPR